MQKVASAAGKETSVQSAKIDSCLSRVSIHCRQCFVGQVTCYAREWSFGTLTSDWRPIPKSEGMTAASKTAVDTGSDTQFTKVSPYVRDIRKAWDVQVREIAQRREELGTIIPTAEHVVLSWRIGNRK